MPRVNKASIYGYSKVRGYGVLTLLTYCIVCKYIQYIPDSYPSCKTRLRSRHIKRAITHPLVRVTGIKLNLHFAKPNIYTNIILSMYVNVTVKV